MADKELFTVIIATYRNQRYLTDSIGSVLMQTYPAIELIVVDDGSENFDEPAVYALVDSMRRENLKAVDVYTNLGNLGTVKSVNRALKRAHGQYIKLLAADDALYDASSLQNARDALDQSRDGLLISHVMGCTPEMKESGLFRDAFLHEIPLLDAKEQYRRLCTRNRITACGVYFRRDYFEKNGLFDEQYRLLEDWPTWLRATRTGTRFDVGDFLGARYRSNVGSATGVVMPYLEDKERTFQTEIRPYRKELGLWLYLWAWMMLRLRNAKLVRTVFGWLFRKKGR